MDGDRFRRVGEIFSRARRIDDPAARDAFVADVCGDDAGLREELRTLLRAHDRPEPPRAGDVRGLLEDAVDRVTRPETPWMPEEIAGFRVKGLLGVGGMGAVYEAEQDRPRRTVALKVLRADAATAELRGRFEREAAILGRLQHEGIARVYEVGTTETPAGTSPYIAMEPVDGVDLLRYAGSRNLGLPARLDLLLEICAAVEHAHQHGVVHRDLKPGNILVTDAGEPKVLDFGVARPLDDTVGRYTRENQVIGTIGYMSPEQVRTDDVDTRSDIYALGVLAYELLAGRHPHADDRGSLPTALKAILDKDPPPLGHARRELRGDLTVIVGTAMAKERDRRYQSVSALAEDIRRYRTSRPILARPPTTTYVLRKFVRRHKALVAGSLTTVLALVVGLVLALEAANREARERLRAERLAAEGQIAAVAGALLRFDGRRAAERLDQIPARHRDWEWRYLRAAADRSTGFFAAPSRRYACVLGKDGVLAPAAHRAVAVRTLRSATNYRSAIPDVVVRDARDAPLLCVPQGRPAAVGFEHRGRRLRARVGKYEIVVADAAGAEVARIRQGHVLRSVAVNGDGTRLAVAGGGGKVLQAWDWERARRLWEVRMDSTHVTFLSFSPDGARLAASSGDGTLRILSAADGTTRRVLMGHSGPVYGVAFAAADRLVSVGADGVRVWDPAATDRLDVLAVHRSYEEGNRYPYVYSVVADPSGRRIFSGGWDRTIRITDFATGERLATLACPDAAPKSLSLHGDRLAAAWPGLFVYDLATLSTVHAVPRVRSPAYDTALFSPDGSRLLVTERPGEVRLLDARTLAAVATWDGAAASGAVWLPDGTRVAGIDDATVWVRAAADGRAIARVECGGKLHSLAASPDGRWLAAAGTDDVVYLIDADDARIAHRMVGHTETVYALAFHPESARLASGADDNTIRMWDVARGRELLVLDGHTSYVFGLAFAPDGRTLLSASGDNTVRVWSTVPYAERTAAARTRRATWARLAGRAEELARRHGDGAVAAVRTNAALADDEREALTDLLWKRAR